MIVDSASPDPLADSSNDLRELRRPRRPLGGRTAVLVLAGCAAAALPLSACSSGSGHTASSAVTKTCQQVSAVLSDGPDPDSDPVGYAEAQILPLRQLHTSDPALRSAISRLATAYDQFFARNGKSAAATSAVAAATAQMNKVCPGAAA